MTSKAYRILVARIIRNIIKKEFPGIKQQPLIMASAMAATSIHARMYGANVDNVASPIWRGEGDRLPEIDAEQLLKEGLENEA